MAISRRDFLALTGSAAAATVGPFSTSAHAAMGPDDKFDLVINNKRDGNVLLKPVQTVINGVPFGRPYQSPFSVR